MSSAGIRDVARLAEVSTATVSRVLNGTARVNQETKKRVLAACAELDYSPNTMAQRLSLGRTNTISAVLPFLTLPSIVERLRGIQEVLSESNYDLVPFSVGSPEQRDKYLADLSRKSRTDGLLIISMPPTKDHVDRLIKLHMPTVLVDAFHPNLNRVNVDDIAGGRLATQYLIDLGHRRIAFISDHFDTPLSFSSMRERYQGFCETMNESDLTCYPAYFCQGEHGREFARELGLKLLRMQNPPTAIFAASDTQAIGVLDAARELNINVPDQLSVIGYDDIRDAEYVNLTTIKQPLLELGIKGAELLLKIIPEPQSSPIEITLPLELIIRKTTAPPPTH
ncbi:MAG: LacI family DNA-binding transcriptional regulator [Anaerolineaceae bacterium]|nr:LacI family DNA-binding transcriptional regulator [Anaerolineaceae bacterium]